MWRAEALDVGGFLSREDGLLVVSPVLLAAVLGLDVETARDVVDVLTDFSDFYIRVPALLLFFLMGSCFTISCAMLGGIAG